MKTFKRLLAAAIAMAALLPAAAAAQTQIPPPQGDNYLSPIFLNNESQPFPDRTPIAFNADTTNYTTQADMFNPPGSGGPAEPTTCGFVNGQPDVYSNTIWSVFFANRYGLMDISTAGPFDSVIGVVTFDKPSNPRPQLPGSCTDTLSGFQEELKGIVVPNQWYAVQVGGTGATRGGQLQVKFTYGRPPNVAGDAVLTWNTGNGGAIVKSLVVSRVSKGATVIVTCSHHGCGKNPKRVTAKKPLAQGAVFKPFVHEAKRTFRFLGGRKAKSGTTIEVKILEPGFNGEDFQWKVKGNGIGTKVVRCIKPGTSKPRKKCS